MQEIVLISIPETTIRNIVEQAVRKVIAETQTLPVLPNDGKQLISRKEAADLAGISIASVDNKAKEGILTKYRTGGVVRFRKDEVIAAFSQTMFSPNPRLGRALTKKP